MGGRSPCARQPRSCRLPRHPPAETLPLHPWYDCDPLTCLPANNCRCASMEPPLPADQMPQFVLYTVRLITGGCIRRRALHTAAITAAAVAFAAVQSQAAADVWLLGTARLSDASALCPRAVGPLLPAACGFSARPPSHDVCLPPLSCDLLPAAR